MKKYKFGIYFTIVGVFFLGIIYMVVRAYNYSFKYSRLDTVYESKKVRAEEMGEDESSGSDEGDFEGH